MNDHSRLSKAFSKSIRDCAIITWSGVFGKLEGGGIGENDNKREGGLDVKFSTFRGGVLLFHSDPFCKLEK